MCSEVMETTLCVWVWECVCMRLPVLAPAIMGSVEGMGEQAATSLPLHLSFNTPARWQLDSVPLTGLQHSDMMGLFTWSYHSLCLNRAEWDEGNDGAEKKKSPARETPVWPYHRERLLISLCSLINPSFIWQGATDSADKDTARISKDGSGSPNYSFATFRVLVLS